MSGNSGKSSGLPEGFDLTSGWKVGKKLDVGRGIHATAYTAFHEDGTKGFLKVLDYEWYMLSDDPAEVLRAVSQAFLDERRLLMTARDNGLNRVVRIFTSGVIRRTGHQPLQYLICELAEGDACCQLTTHERKDDKWAVRALHATATGVAQLHEQRIAHQDLKPQNVFRFEDCYAKVGDLGRAVDPTASAEHVEYTIAGDEAYAPPELLYEYVDPEWNVRRLGCDIYLFGSLIVSMLGGGAVTPLVQSKLDPAHRVSEWRGTYRDVLPYVRHAFTEVLAEFSATIAERIPDEHTVNALTQMVAQLCDPDPTLRGDPTARLRQTNPFALERYISQLDLIARRLDLLPSRSVA